MIWVTTHAAQDNDKVGKSAKPLIVVRNETFGGSSQILKTSGHKEKAGYSVGFSYLVHHAGKGIHIYILYMHFD